MGGGELDENGLVRRRSAFGDHVESAYHEAPAGGWSETAYVDSQRLAALVGRGGTNLRSAGVLGMQQTHGNRAVQRYMGKSLLPVSRMEWDEVSKTVESVSEWLTPLSAPSRAMQRINNYSTQFALNNPDAGIMDTLSATFDSERAHGRESASQIKRAEHMFGSGVEFVEGKISGGAHWLADQAEGIPGLDMTARQMANDISNSAQVGTGVLKGAGTMVGGIAGMIANPIDTIVGLGSLAEHVPTYHMGIPNPVKLAHNAYDVVANDKPVTAALDSVFNPVTSMREDGEFFMQMGKGLIEPYAEAAGRGRYGEMLGRGAFDIGSLFIGAGEARGAAEVGQVARTAEGVEAAAAAVRGAEGAEAARLAAQGAEAARVAEGLEGASVAARSPVPPRVVPAPIEFGPGVATASPVPDVGAFALDEITEVTRRAGDTAVAGGALSGEAVTMPGLAVPEQVKLASPMPVDLPPTTPTVAPVPTEAFGVDEITEVIRRDALDTLPDAPATVVPAPVEFGPGPSQTNSWDEVTEVIRRDSLNTLPDAPVKDVPAPVEFGPGPQAATPTTQPASLIDKALDGFKQLIGGNTKIKDAPGKVSLPEQLMQGLKDAWDNSFPGGAEKEQGGLLVQGKDGKLNWKPEGPAAGTANEINFNYKGVAPDEKVVASGHTHPYNDGTVNIGQSSGDISRMVVADEPVALAQSGERSFMTAKTEEFSQRVQGLDKAGKEALMSEIDARWQEIYDEAIKNKKSFEESVREANQATHAEYDLLYYEGEGGVLSR
jgi:hypothetical protein